MPKRCMPGVICIENVTITLTLIIIGSGILFLNLYNKKDNWLREKIIIKENNYASNYGNNSEYMPQPGFSYSNNPDDVLMNPYKAPLRDDRFFPRGSGDPRGIPINIPTQSVDSSYRQVGLLTRLNGAEMILPLMGRPLFTNRDKWNFYTMSDKSNMIKLPITNKGRSCTNEYGCDNLYNGDTVYVEGYNDAFKVTVYDNQIMRYIPFL
jgi:hypothetical protein